MTKSNLGSPTEIAEVDNRSWPQKLREFETLQILQTGTLLWLIILLGFIAATQQCAWQWYVPWYRPDLLYFSCRTTNELGDFLAGAFAPLAFLWLAGAVFIQSKELGAQREVLGYQRDELERNTDELEHTREVLKQQVDTSRALAETSAKQTSVFVDQNERAKRETADETFEQLLISILANAKLCSFGKVEIFLNVPYKSSNLAQSGQKFFEITSSMTDVSMILDQIANPPASMQSILNNVDNITIQSTTFISCRSGGSLYELYSAISQAAIIRPLLTVQGKIRHRQLQCETAFNRMNDIIKLFADSDQKKLFEEVTRANQDYI